MVNIPNVVVLVARVTKNGSVTKPEEQPLRSFRAARLVGDPRRFLFLSTLKEGFDSDKQGIQALLKDWIANGIQVGGIRYTWLGYSDVHVKAGKVIFFREDANWTVRRLLQEIGDVHQVFLDHGHGKYAARLGLSFSSTVDAKDVYGRTVLLDDLRARDGSLHTDGCGMIRASYARELCNTLHIPEDTSVFQIRCGGVKGLLSAYPDPDFERLCNTENKILNRDIVGSEVVIAFRRSMLKYNGGPTMLEINDHCSRPGSARLNEFIILHLLTLGVAWDVFRKLLLDQLDFIGAIANDRNKALRAVKGELDASSTVFGQDLYSLLLACQDLKEPYVQWKLSLFQQKQYDNLREKLSIAVEDSAYLFGVVDEYGILEADEVFINIPGRIGVLAKPSIMVCRNPSYDPGDIRTFRAVYREELKHLTNCIVFSRKSRHSVPDTMASGDLDGDMYLTVWDTNLVPQSVRDYVDRPASASAASGTARSRNDHVDMAQAAMSTFIDHRFNGLLGIMATEWKLAAICSPHLTDEPHARKLGLLTESALDAIKSGTNMQELKRRFFAVRTQARNAAARYRDFRNPLNCLRDLVPRKDGAKISSFTCDDALLIQDQDPKVWDDVMREARQAMREFNRELSQALRVDGEWKDEQYGDTERNSFRNHRPKHADDVTMRFRERYFGGGTFAEMYVQRMRASAWYQYGYSEAKQAFAWLGISYLNEIRAVWSSYGKPVLYVGSTNRPTHLESRPISASSSISQESTLVAGEPASHDGHSPKQQSVTIVSNSDRSGDPQCTLTNSTPRSPVASILPPCNNNEPHDWRLFSANGTQRTYLCGNCGIKPKEKKKDNRWQGDPSCSTVSQHGAPASSSSNTSIMVASTSAALVSEDSTGRETNLTTRKPSGASACPSLEPASSLSSMVIVTDDGADSPTTSLSEYAPFARASQFERFYEQNGRSDRSQAPRRHGQARRAQGNLTSPTPGPRTAEDALQASVSTQGVMPSPSQAIDPAGCQSDLVSRNRKPLKPVLSHDHRDHELGAKHEWFVRQSIGSSCSYECTCGIVVHERKQEGRWVDACL